MFQSWNKIWMVGRKYYNGGRRQRLIGRPCQNAHSRDFFRDENIDGIKVEGLPAQSVAYRQ